MCEADSRRSSSFSRLMARGEFCAICEAIFMVAVFELSARKNVIHDSAVDQAAGTSGCAVNSISLQSSIPPVFIKF